jgi:hypothetical protein
MADPEKKDEHAHSSGAAEDSAGNGAGTGNGNGTANGSGRSQASGVDNEQLNAILLAIIEREIGRGEPRRPEQWQTLREMAVGQPSGQELVSTFEGVIDRCNDELTKRFGAHGVDLTRLRESVVMLIRVSLAKKLGLSGIRPKES